MQMIFQLWSQLRHITAEKGLYSKRRRLESCYFTITMVNLEMLRICEEMTKSGKFMILIAHSAALHILYTF